MSNLNFNAPHDLKNGKYYVGLSLIEFFEDDINIVYSPALDLSGYGKNDKKAKISFFIALNEFLTYAENRKTFAKMLKDLGWITEGTKENRRFNPPKDSDLILSNSLYNEIVNNKSYKVSPENIAFSI